MRDSNSIPPPTRSVVITNNGNANLVFAPSAFTLSPDSGDYTISGTCSPNNPVAPDANCTVTIEFNPQGASIRSTTLTIASNDPAAQSVTLTGIGMNVFYQFGAGTDPSAVPACFDVVADSQNPSFRMIDGLPIVPCGTPPTWANASMGYDTEDYGCLLMSTASALSTFQSYALTTPAILDPSEFHDFVDVSASTDPENGLYWPSGSGDITPGLSKSKIPNFLEACNVAGEVLTGGCNTQKGAPLTLNEYLYQKVVAGKNPVILQLAEDQSCTSGTHYVTVIAPVNVTAPDGGGDWLLFDPGWQAANTQTNYLLLSPA
jgi:hypothetical protein